MGILRYIIRRLLLSVLMLIGVSAIVFSLINAIGNPIDLLLAERPGVTQEVINSISKYYGLDKPAISRYFTWVWNMLHGDFGTSIMYNQKVADMLKTWGLETLKI